MDVQDGFIVGIYNYCDRWCETCSFTSRCRVFADRAELEAQSDPQLSDVVNAPPLQQDLPPPLPFWMRELIDEMNKIASEPMSKEELEQLHPTLIPAHKSIEERAYAYCERAHTWLDGCRPDATRDSSDPLSVIGWFQYSIPAKIHRALMGLAMDEPDDRDWPADYDGSAKVALLGMERSHAAWLALVHGGLASVSEAEPFVADLIWLTDELERVFPNARGFVRPAFDEPDEVARLLAADC